MRTWAATLAFGATLAVAEPAYKHGVSFFGEFKYPPDFEHFDYVNPNAPKGGLLVLATGANFNSFTPYLNKGTSVPGVNHSMGSQPFLYDGLFVPSDDEIGTFYGNLAGAVMVADDFSWVRLQLRPEAHWHDGVPITATDVKFTFDHIRENSGFNLQSAFGMVDSVEIHGERELTIRLNNINGLNAAVVTSLGKIAILPEHYWREHDNTRTTQTPALGSGPYRVKDFRQSRYLLYERVPDYWGRNLGVNRGRHNFDHIRYDYYRDGTVVREAFRKGHVDYRRETDPRYWFNGYDIPARHKGWIVMRQHNFQYYVGLMRGIVINERREHLRDRRVREALTLAFDYAWYGRNISQGFYRPARSHFGPPNFSAVGLPGAAELALLEPFRDELPQRLFTQAFERGRSEGVGRDRAGLLRARELLRESGWTVRDGFLRNDDGEPLSLTFLIRSAGERRLILQYVDQLKRLGFRTIVRMVDSAQFINLMKEFDFDFSFAALGVAQPPGVEVVSYWHSSNAMLPQTRNLSGIQSAAADEMIMRVLNARSRDELSAAQKALDRVLLWNFDIIPLLQVEGPHVVYWDKFGRPPYDAEFRTSFPEAWWYDEEKAARIPSPD